MYSRCRNPDRAPAPGNRRTEARLALLVAASCVLAACTGKGGETVVPPGPPSQDSVQGTPISPMFPGGGSAPAPSPLAAKYANDEHAIAEGARLYDWYNCAGCHFHGAGGIGPALGDTQWIYGGSMEQIYSTIYQGRPNGMPSWGRKLSTTEIWEIAAYVHDLPTKFDHSGDVVPPLPAVADGDAREPQAQSYPSAYPPGEEPSTQPAPGESPPSAQPSAPPPPASKPPPPAAQGTP
jgi:cytochrome c oxidase cbb3-type subunit 3